MCGNVDIYTRSVVVTRNMDTVMHETDVYYNVYTEKKNTQTHNSNNKTMKITEKYKIGK